MPKGNANEIFTCQKDPEISHISQRSLTLLLTVLHWPGRVALSVARLTLEKARVPGSIPGPVTYFRFSFH